MAQLLRTLASAVMLCARLKGVGRGPQFFRSVPVFLSFVINELSRI